MAQIQELQVWSVMDHSLETQLTPFCHFKFADLLSDECDLWLVVNGCFWKPSIDQSKAVTQTLPEILGPFPQSYSSGKYDCKVLLKTNLVWTEYGESH